MSDWQQQLKAELAAAARAAPAYPDGRFAGRGIVICAGGARLFTCAWVLIALLRRQLGCRLAIEVWHLGAQELGPPMAGLIKELDAEPVDAQAVAARNGAARLGGWELKPYAILHSRFSEVLLLDADNVPVRDPAFLFEIAEYQQSGALFWPDIVRLSRANAMWAIGGLDHRDAPAWETGQLVLDKARCWPALWLTHWINQRSELFYRFLYGDKDTFLLAWLLLEQPHHVVQRLPKQLDGTLCQRTPEGDVLFQHRSNAKWILDGDNPVVEGFRFEEECRALLEELAGKWDGRVFNPPARSEDACSIEAGLARTRAFTLTLVSADGRTISLLPDHRVLSPVASERYWYVADGEAGAELRVEGNGLPAFDLRHDGNGRWLGRLLQAPGMPVELVPREAAGGAAARPAWATTGVTAVLDRALDLCAALPWDGEAERDLLGAVRLLSALDPGLAGHLAQAGQSEPPGPRGRAIAAAIKGLCHANAWAPPATRPRDRTWEHLGGGYERP